MNTYIPGKKYTFTKNMQDLLLKISIPFNLP